MAEQPHQQPLFIRIQFSRLNERHS
jgi:hypothetical protein